MSEFELCISQGNLPDLISPKAISQAHGSCPLQTRAPLRLEMIVANAKSCHLSINDID